MAVTDSHGEGQKKTEIEEDTEETGEGLPRFTFGQIKIRFSKK